MMLTINENLMVLRTEGVLLANAAPPGRQLLRDLLVNTR